MLKKIFPKLNFWQKSILFFYFMAILLILTVILINLNVASISQPYIFTEMEKLPQAQTVLILGASVYQNKTLSDMLKDRADTAVELYQAGKVKNFLISGDNRNRNYNETATVQKYLLNKEIPQEKIFLDYAGFDTFDSLYRARDVFLAKNLIIATQSFHLPRAVYLARQLGLTAYGFSADKHSYKNIWLNVGREKLANIKAFFDVNFGSKPQFLGQEIPIL